jgi:replicative DNA helicase
MIEKLYSHIFAHTNEKVREIYLKMHPDWNTNQMHRDWFNAIGSLVQNNSEIDMMTIVDELRNQKTYSPQHVSKMSELSSKCDFTNINSLINQIHFDHTIKNLNFKQMELKREIDNPNISPSRVIEILDDAKDLLIQKESKQRSNVDVIFDVITKHNNAKNGIVTGLEIGFMSLKNKIMLEPIDVMVVGGRPAMGKTAWMISAVKKLAFDQNKVVAVFSLEMSTEQLMRRMLAHLCDIDSNSIKYGKLNETEIKHIYDIQQQPEWKNIHFFEGSHNTIDITRELTHLKNTVGCDVFFIDYLQKILPQKSESRYQEVTKISNDIKRLSMGMKIPCIALAQLSRDSAKSGKRPSLPDLKESGEIEQDASVVAFLHRPEYYGETHNENGEDLTGIGEFIIGKNREGECTIEAMHVDLKTSSWIDNEKKYNFVETHPDQFIESTSLNQFRSETPF